MSSASAAAELRTTVEVAVQLVGFRNVDLFSQGIYQLRVSACAASSGRAATPLRLLEEKGSDNEGVGGVAAPFLLPAHVLEASGEFCTAAFRVRYCEEEVPLRAFACLRVDLAPGE